MATIKMTTKGFDEYLELLAKAGKDVDVAAARAVAIGAQVVQASMQQMAPVKTGNLKAHIKILGPERDGNFTFVEVGIINKKSYTDEKTAKYANAQEFGTSKMAAHPYIRPGFLNAKKRAIDAMRKSLEQDAIL